MSKERLALNEEGSAFDTSSLPCSWLPGISGFCVIYVICREINHFQRFFLFIVVLLGPNPQKVLELKHTSEKIEPCEVT